mmetsp:Transcript_90096/g.273423  ORF Transcript_90096/g.273423 Transcript_90096/m.273423 type:complete len:490 (+) Transcript_90096:43-1512(+)
MLRQISEASDESWISQYVPTSSSEPLLRRQCSGSEKIKELKQEASAVDGLRSKCFAKLHDPLTGTSVKRHWGKVSRKAFAIAQEHRLKRSPWRQRLGYWIKSAAFKRFVIFMVLANGICIAVETDSAPLARPRLSACLRLLEYVFTLFFAAEAALKIAAYGFQKVWAARHLRFEFVLAAMGVLDLFFVNFADNEAGKAGLNALPCLRVVRFALVFNSGEFGIITRCLLPVFGTLFYVSLFLFLIIFVFSVPVVRLVGQNQIWQETPEVAQRFGNMPRAIFGLLQMMIDPDMDLMRMLFEQQPWTGPFLLLFVLMTTYSVMSIIVGSIADNYKSFADAERAKLGGAERQERDTIRLRLLEQLRKADEDEPGLVGALSLGQFLLRLQTPIFKRDLEELGVEEDQVCQLLQLLQVDGHIYYAEFIDALGSLGKGAEATDLIVLRARLTEEFKRLQAHVDEVAERLSAMEPRLARRIDEGFAALRAELQAGRG